MANEVSPFPGLPAGSYFPYQLYRGVVPAGSHVNMHYPNDGDTILIVALDVGIVSAVTSGYVQWYDAGTGNTIWVEQPNGLETSYASWRGLYIQNTPGESPHPTAFFNNTTADVGLSVAGFVWASPSVTSWFGSATPPPT